MMRAAPPTGHRVGAFLGYATGRGRARPDAGPDHTQPSPGSAR